MKRIIICCDGTWNTRDQRDPTNVSKINDALSTTAPDGTWQEKHYHDGVGTRSWVDKLPGGIFGSGLWRNVKDVYQFLLEVYEAGDEIFLFGFSRGAYTARSVAGMVRKCGILRPDEIDFISDAYDLYRDRSVPPDAPRARDFRRDHAVALPPLHPGMEPNLPPITFVGVWDTVGSLGIPLGLLGSFFNRKYRFHDVSLSRIVANAYQALAIDEKRKPFRPTLWEQHPAAIDQKLEQRWFAGVHTDIGGGNDDQRQSDRALLWMMSKAAAAGCSFDAEYIRKSIGDDPNGPLGDSLFGRIARHVPFDLLTYDRPIGEGVPVAEATYIGGQSYEIVDSAVIDRNARDASYMPRDVVAYYRATPEALVAAKSATRSVWP